MVNGNAQGRQYAYELETLSYAWSIFHIDIAI